MRNFFKDVNYEKKNHDENYDVFFLFRMKKYQNFRKSVKRECKFFYIFERILKYDQIILKMY